MLEFKFRAWHKKAGNMIPWDLLCNMMDGKRVCVPVLNGPNPIYDPTKTPADFPIITIRGNPFQNENMITMQYCGFSDSKNREIYEEDIIAAPEWENYSPRIGIMKRTRLIGGLGIFFHVNSGTAAWCQNQAIVLGNTFQNRDLL